MIEARYHDSVNVLQEMFSDQSEAFKARSPFDRAQWFSLLAETGLTPLIAIGKDGDHQAALALHEEAGRLSPLKNWYSFVWRPLAPEGAQGDRLIHALAKRLRSRAHRVTMTSVPDEDRSAHRLAAAFAKAGWRVEVSQCDTNHILHVNGRSFEEYWAKRPGHLRTTWKRKSGKVRVRILDRFDSTAWDEYESVYADSWKPTEGEPAMLRAFARAEGEAGRLRLGLADHEGRSVAAQFWTIENQTAYIHKLAHRESHRSLSAGTTLCAALFRRAIDEDGVEMVDFGNGDDSYKRDWMEAVRPRYQIDCLDMRKPKAWVDLTRLALSRSRLATLPALAPMPIEG